MDHNTTGAPKEKKTVDMSARLHLRSPGNTYVPGFRFSRFDAAVIILVVLISAGAALMIFQSAQSSIKAASRLEAVLTVSGEEVWRADLSRIVSEETYTVNVDTGSLTVLAIPDEVRVLSSDCLDQICVHTGSLTSAGQAAVCLPFRAVLKIVSVDGQGDITADTTAAFDVISK